MIIVIDQKSKCQSLACLLSIHENIFGTWQVKRYTWAYLIELSAKETTLHVKLGQCCCSSTLVQLSFPNMVCLHFSVTHRSTVTPVAPPAFNRRTSPLWTTRPGFQSCDSNPSQLNKTISENSGPGGYLTGESNYNWRLNARQTPGNLTLTTVHKKSPYRWEWLLKWFSASGYRQGREVFTKPWWLKLTDKYFEE